MRRNWGPGAAVVALTVALTGGTAMAAAEPLSDRQLDRVVAGTAGEVAQLQETLFVSAILPRLQVLFGADEIDDTLKLWLLEVLGADVAPGQPMQTAGALTARAVDNEPAPMARSVLRLGPTASLMVGRGIGGNPEISVTTVESADGSSASATIVVALDQPGMVQLPGIAVSASAGN